MRYQLRNGTEHIFQIDDQGNIAAVPNDMANKDWQAYQAWLAQGNEPEPAE